MTVAVFVTLPSSPLPFSPSLMTRRAVAKLLGPEYFAQGLDAVELVPV